MWQTHAWVALLAMVALSGCLSADPDEAPNPSPVSVGPIEAPLNGTGCLVVAAIIPVEHEVAAKWLPIGYTTADAGELLGLPLPADQAAIGVANVQCADSRLSAFEFATSLIFVKEPNFDAELTPNMVDGYSLEWFGTTGQVGALLDSLHLNPRIMDVSMDTEVEGSDFNGNLRSISRAHATWLEGATIVWSSEVTGAAPFSFPGDGFRAWSEGPNGTTIYEAKLDLGTDLEPQSIVFSAGALECTMAEDTKVAVVTGSNQCAPAPNVGLNVLDFDFTGSGFRHFPDQFA